MLVSVCEGASLNDLSKHLSRRFVASRGENCIRSHIFGRNGQNLTIRVPPGTVVLSEKGKQVCMCVHMCVCKLLLILR